MHNLLIDIGNSDVKTGICKSGKAVLINSDKAKLLKRFSYDKKNFAKDFSENFKTAFHSDKKYVFNKIGISILESTNKEFLTEYFKKKFEVNPEFINRKSVKNIKILYKKGLGNDRLCNAVAADYLNEKKNILIIDFGTATTFTLVLNNKLKGGLISPGIRTSLKSLTNNTSLPEINLTFPENLINDNTIDNIRSGVLYQSLFMAERTILDLKKIHRQLFVIATGGNSDFIVTKTKLIDKTDKNLVLKGINLIISE